MQIFERFFSFLPINRQKVHITAVFRSVFSWSSVGGGVYLYGTFVVVVVQRVALSKRAFLEEFWCQSSKVLIIFLLSIYFKLFAGESGAIYKLFAPKNAAKIQLFAGITKFFYE